MKQIFIRTALTVLAILFLAAALQAAEITASEIIKRMESNQTHETSRATGKMIIYDRYGESVKSFIMTSEGSKAMMLEFTNPEDEGQKILRLDDEIYLYFPGAEKVIIIQGSALKDKVAGSDFSYEDMTGGKDLLSVYRVSLEGTEDTALEDEKGNVTHVNCYKVKLEAINKRKVVYPIEYIWVDKDLMTYRKVNSCTADGKVLKEMDIIEIKQIAGKNVPTHMVMRDTLKKNSRTVFKIDNIKIGLKLDPDTFGLKELSW